MGRVKNCVQALKKTTKHLHPPSAQRRAQPELALALAVPGPLQLLGVEGRQQPGPLQAAPPWVLPQPVSVLVLQRYLKAGGRGDALNFRTQNENKFGRRA